MQLVPKTSEKVTSMHTGNGDATGVLIDVGHELVLNSEEDLEVCTDVHAGWPNHLGKRLCGRVYLIELMQCSIRDYFSKLFSSRLS